MVRFLRFPSKSLTDVASSIETSSNFISLKTILESPKYSKMSNNCPTAQLQTEVGWVQSDVSECKEKTGKLEETTKMLSRLMRYLKEKVREVEIVQNISLHSQSE